MMRKISGMSGGQLISLHVEKRLYVIPNSAADFSEYGDNIIPFPRKLTKEALEGIPLSLLPECLEIMAERGELYERLSE